MRPFSVLLTIAIVLTASLTVVAQNPTPFVNQPLIPTSTAPGGASFTLTVNGTGFVSGSTVNWNASPRATTFVSSSQLTSTITSSDIAAASTATVTVSSPAPGGGTSNGVFFSVRNASTFVSLNSTGFGTLGNPYSVALGDFNRDGKQDLAALSEGSSPGVLILEGNGDGTFNTGSMYSIRGHDLNAIIAADINNDGNPDLILSDLDLSLVVMLGVGDGTFDQLVEYPSAFPLESAVTGDFNGDGKVDVAAVFRNGICTFLGNGDGTFQPDICFTNASEVFSSLTEGDFDRDGRVDLALTGDGGLVAIFLGNGDGTFQEEHDYPISNESQSLIAADFNGDGILDLAATLQSDNTVAVLLGGGDGSFHSPMKYATGIGPLVTAAADMNGDGTMDLVVGQNDIGVATIAVLLGNGDGSFQNHVDFDGSGLSSLTIGDFNQDGRSDVAVANAFGNMHGITILAQDDGSVLSFEPSRLNFPTQLVDSVSKPKILSVTNNGTLPVSVDNISISPNFSQLHRCKIIQPGKTCKVSVFFTPIQSGRSSGYLSMTDDGGGSPQLVNLLGVGTTVSFSPSSLDFRGLPVGHISKPIDVLLTNEGTTDLSISRVFVGGSDVSDFSQVNACPSSLPAGSHCTISVLFHPISLGARTALLEVADDGGGSPQTVNLTGTGQ